MSETALGLIAHSLQMQSTLQQPVVVIAASNRPDCIDSALLRPGRFDRLLYVPPPDQQARQEILSVHTRCMSLHPDVHLLALAECTTGFTGAEIAAVCRQAALQALDDSITAEHVCMRHFLSAIQHSAYPATLAASYSLEAMYESYRRQVM